jgi:glyoxylate reductase
MKSSPPLINTARGPVVDTDALVDALNSGEIWAAGLDVTDPEPLPADHPLLKIDRALVAPHIASASEVTRGKMADLAARNLLAVLRGETPPRCLNPRGAGTWLSRSEDARIATGGCDRDGHLLPDR